MTIAVSMAVNQRKQRPKGSFPGAVNLERSLDAIRSEWRGSLDVPHDVAFSSLSHRGMVPTAGGTVEPDATDRFTRTARQKTRRDKSCDPNFETRLT